MKVVLITFLYETEIGGGAANVVNGLAYSLRQLGIDVVVITTHGERKPIIDTVNGIKIYRIFPKNLYWVAEKNHQPVYKKVIWQLLDIWNPDAFRQIKHILDQEQPDVVHVHKLRGLSPSVWQAAYSSGCRRIVQSCHDYELKSPEGTMTSGIGQLSHRDFWLLRPYGWLRARFSNLVHVATAPSAYTLQELAKSGFFPCAQHEVIPNTHGFDTAQLTALQNRYRNKAEENSNGQIRLLYLGRIESNKGVDSLCAAFVPLAERYQGMHLDIVGWGIQEERLRQEYGDHPQITFHGPVFGEQKLSLLAASSVLVVPSTGPEVFGIVVVEAFAYGKPVVAAAIGGLPELVEDGITGYLFPSGDSEALKDILCKLAAHPEMVTRLSDACFDAARLYATDVVTHKYLSTYGYY